MPAALIHSLMISYISRSWPAEWLIEAYDDCGLPGQVYCHLSRRVANMHIIVLLVISASLALVSGIKIIDIDVTAPAHS